MKLTLGDKIALLGLFVTIIPIIYFIFHRHEESLKFEITRKTTVSKLSKYKEILHAERKPYFDGKLEDINNLLMDSTDVTDELLITMLTNNSTKIESWKDRLRMKQITKETFIEENTKLFVDNNQLYNQICKKYKIKIDKTFFKHYSLY